MRTVVFIDQKKGLNASKYKYTLYLHNNCPFYGVRIGGERVALKYVTSELAFVNCRLTI